MTRVRYRFQPKRTRVAHAAAAGPERVPRVARLLALAHSVQGMLDQGEVASMADFATAGRKAGRWRRWKESQLPTA